MAKIVLAVIIILFINLALCGDKKKPLRNLATKCTRQEDSCKAPSQCALFALESTENDYCVFTTENDEILPGICCSNLTNNNSGQNVLPEDIEDENHHNNHNVENLSNADISAIKDNAKLFLKQLKDIENKIKTNDIKVDKSSPIAGHMKVFQTESEAREIALQALQLAETTKTLKSRLGPVDSDNELRQINVFDNRNTNNNNRRCPPLPSCPSFTTKYRTHDGSCNNLRRTWIGKAMTPTQRLLHPHYEDGVQIPRLARDRSTLPSAREISNELSKNGDRAPQDVRYTALVADFGQFVDHDMTLSPVFTLSGGEGIQCCERDGSGPLASNLRHPQCLPILISKHDQFFARFNQRCMNFVRTMPALTHNCSLGAIQQMNAVSHWLDGSMVYGSNADQARQLMASKGRLKTSGSSIGPSSLLPPQRSGCIQRNARDNPDFCFQAGDTRVNEQPMLVSLTILFMREHNRIADALSSIHPSWTSIDIYQEARRIVIAEIQHITYNEFLPVILGRKFMETYGLTTLHNGLSNDYNQNYDASVTNEFSAAAFRLHTLVRGSFKFQDEAGRSENIKLSRTLNSPQILFWPESGDALLRGQSSRPLGAFDYVISDEMTQHLFQTGGPFGLDIFSLNIQRGRDHGLPGYNTYRKLCGLPRAKTFDDLSDTVRPEVIPILRQLYRDVEDIDLYVGGISERRSSGSLLGHTFLCLVGDQFARMKKGDRFFYDLQDQSSSFSSEQLTEIRKTSLARIICDNSASLRKIQPLVFLQSDDLRNPIVFCDSSLIPKINLHAWRDELPQL